MVQGARLTTKGGNLSCGMLCQRLGQMEKLKWIPVRQCKYLKEIQTDKPHCIEKIRWAENRQILREQRGTTYIFFYFFPSVVINEQEIPVRYTLGHNTYNHFYGHFQIPWHFQLLLSRAADCLQQKSKLYKIPSFTPADLFCLQGKWGQFICWRLRGRALLPNKQTDRTSTYLDC